MDMIEFFIMNVNMGYNKKKFINILVIRFSEMSYASTHCRVLLQGTSSCTEFCKDKAYFHGVYWKSNVVVVVEICMRLVQDEIIYISTVSSH